MSKSSSSLQSAISIHAPRGGSDSASLIMIFGPRVFQSTLPAGGATTGSRCGALTASDFNPRSPRGERQGMDDSFYCAKLFQSTLPAGGATTPKIMRGGIRLYFNPRSPRGERLNLTNKQAKVLDISIHAPRGGSDRTCGQNSPRCLPFQSTLPAGGATRNWQAAEAQANNFNPRSPRGERRQNQCLI